MPTDDRRDTDPFPLSRETLGHQLRTHAYQLAHQEDLGETARVLIDKLWQMADQVDGGTGPNAHHGCPDMTIPTHTCTECHLVVDWEVDAGAREPTIFAPPAAS